MSLPRDTTRRRTRPCLAIAGISCGQCSHGPRGDQMRSNLHEPGTRDAIARNGEADPSGRASHDIRRIGREACTSAWGRGSRPEMWAYLTGLRGVLSSCFRTPQILLLPETRMKSRPGERAKTRAYLRN